MSETFAYTSDTTSATFKAVDTISEFRVSGTYIGRVTLQSSIGGVGEWKNEVSTTGQIRENLLTPSIDTDYRVIAEVESGTVNIHFGP